MCIFISSSILYIGETYVNNVFSIAFVVLLSHVMMRAMFVHGMLKVGEDYLRYLSDPSRTLYILILPVDSV